MLPDLDENQDIKNYTPAMKHNWKYLIKPSGTMSEKTNNNKEIIIKSYDNFGHLKSKDHGLEHHMQVWHEYSIKKEDPLSASLIARWETFTKKDENEMLVKSEHNITCDKLNFICKLSLKAYLNNKIFHEKNWDEKIPRRWQ